MYKIKSVNFWGSRWWNNFSNYMREQSATNNYDDYLDILMQTLEEEYNGRLVNNEKLAPAIRLEIEFNSKEDATLFILRWS